MKSELVDNRKELCRFAFLLCEILPVPILDSIPMLLEQFLRGPCYIYDHVDAATLPEQFWADLAVGLLSSPTLLGQS